MRMLEETASVLEEAMLPPDDRLRRSRSETHNQIGTHAFEFSFEPGLAGGDLARRWFLVQAALASFFEFEVLYGICYIHFGSIDARFFQRAVEELPGGAYEGMA
ncbi:MAG TPA: hypothetical protein VG297_22910 [Bryobacteraceae bacterium]|nr:hypothetical protein [Bryobacteraceae bacterium]